MNWALEALELEPDADERAIKRAYARLLRDNRPDEHPEAFQRLHEAYQTALQWQRYRQNTADELQIDQADEGITWTLQAAEALEVDATSLAQPVNQAEAAPAQLQQAAALPVFDHRQGFETAQIADLQALEVEDGGLPTHAIDIGGLVERTVAAAQQLAPEIFDRWLLACPELWSLSIKSETSDALLSRFWNGSDCINGSNFDLIATAFGWDEIGTHVDPDTLMVMATTMHQRWLWQPGNEAALALQLQTDEDAPATLPETKLCRTLLSRPWRHLQALLSAANPSRQHMMRGALQHVGGEGAHLCPPLQEEQLRFWRDVTTGDRLTRDRVFLGLIRGGVLAMLWLLLPLTAYLMKANEDLQAGYGWPSPGDLLPLGLTGMAFMLLFGMGLLPWKMLLRWLRLPSTVRPVLPLLAVATLVLGRIEGDFAGGTLGAITLWLAWRQAIPHFAKMLDISEPRNFAIVFTAAVFIITALRGDKMPLSYSEISAGIAALLLAYDLIVVHRRRVRARAPEPAPQQATR